MKTTLKYGLYLEDDNTTTFQDWRERINGVTDSNMVKIDTALGEKADHSKSIPATLLASGWIGTAAPYRYTLEVSGLTAGQNGGIGMAHEATPAEREAARKAMIVLEGQEDGVLRLVADGKAPEIDLPAVITISD